MSIAVLGWNGKILISCASAKDHTD